MARSPEQSRSAATRRRLREAAVIAFAERGFHGTTTRDIAKAAGMSPAVLYVHYSSKEELLYLISRTGHDEVLRVITDAVATSTTPVQQLRAVMHAFVVHHLRSHTSARIVNYELAELSEEHHAEVVEVRRRIDGVFRDLVERGTEAGVFEVANPRLAVVALQSLGIDIARWYREGGWNPDEVAAEYVDLALRILGFTGAD